MPEAPEPRRWPRVGRALIVTALLASAYAVIRGAREPDYPLAIWAAVWL